jgi:hypothetical protein
LPLYMQHATTVCLLALVHRTLPDLTKAVRASEETVRKAIAWRNGTLLDKRGVLTQMGAAYLPYLATVAPNKDTKVSSPRAGLNL